MGLLNLTLPSVGQPNSTEDVDVVNAFSAIQTALNGNLDEVNVTNLAAAYTTYKRIGQAQASTSTGVAGTYIAALGPPPNNNQQVSNSAATVAAYVLYLDPARFVANARTTKLNLRYMVVTNAVAPAITYTAGLYPITGYSGASGAEPIIQTIGAVVAGSTVAVASPSAAGLTTGASGDFNFPAVGAYVVGIATSGTPTAGTVIDHVIQIDLRQV